MSQVRGRLIFATVFALVGGVALTIALWYPDHPPGASLTALGAFLGLLPFLALPAREDLDALLLWLASTTLGSALAVGIYLYAAYRPGELPRQLATAAALLGLVALAWTAKRQWSPEDPALPNVFPTLQGLGAVREWNQVQFGAIAHEGEGGEPHRIDVYLQNCCAGKRQVRCEVARNLLRKVRGPAPGWLELGPLEVRRLSLNVVTQHWPERTGVDLLFQVSGNGGKRLRLRRAMLGHPYSRIQPHPYLRVRLGPRPEALWEAPLAAPIQNLVWRPAVGTLREELEG